MLIQDKRTPALTDLDPMPFGRHKGVLMQDVPEEYMAYMRDKIGKVVQPDSELAFKALTEHKRHMLLFMNYIHNSWDAISQEIEDDGD